MERLPVSPTLFDILDGYAGDILSGKISVTGPLRKTSPVLTFCQNFYAQFFQNVLKHEITSIDSRMKKEAVSLRRKAKGERTETILLITWFEKLCDIYPDILALAYGGPVQGFREFHAGYMITLIERILGWAKAGQYEELERKAHATLTIFRQAIGRIPQ